MANAVKGNKPDLLKLNLPGSLLPMATTNAMLIIGSNKSHCDCDFPLQLFLVIAGGVGLCLLVMDVLARYVVEWILEDSKVTAKEKKILRALKIMGLVLAFIQWAALVAGSFFVFDNYGFVSFDENFKKNCPSVNATLSAADNDTGKIYCDYSMFVFTFCLATMIWVLIT